MENVRLSTFYKIRLSAFVLIFVSDFSGKPVGNNRDAWGVLAKQSTGV